MISFFVILVGIVLMILSASFGFPSGGGLLVFIRPIPIAMGQGSGGSSLMLLGGLVLLLLTALWFRRLGH